MSLLRVVVLIAIAAALVFWAYWRVRMIREITLAEGKGEEFPLLLFFGGGVYFLRRHSRTVPDGAATRLVFLLLIPLNILLIVLFFVLGRN